MSFDELGALGGSLRMLDLAVVVGYLVMSLGLGLALSRQSSRDEFLTAGRSMGRITVGLSVMATLFSANSFVMYPSTAYGDSLRILLAAAAFLATTPLVIWVFIPVYSKLGCSTAYEYLELRFNLPVRLIGSAMFMLFQFGRLGIVLLLPSIALSVVTGIDIELCILVMGALCILYTVMGGMEAVIWTDVLQVVVLMGGALLCLVLIPTQIEGGWSGTLALADAADKSGLQGTFRILDPSPTGAEVVDSLPEDDE